MFARVLFPHDFSAYADSVLACLPDLKAGGLHGVVLLSVIRHRDVPMPDTLNREGMELWQWSLDERLNVAQMALEGRGLQVWTRIEYGNPAEQIVRVAQDERVNMIVMGAQGATAAQELLIGSTAYDVVRRATVPVLLQKFEVVRELGHVKCHQVCQHAFQRILFPTDFSVCAHAAFQVVKQLKATGVHDVIVLHVQDERVMKHRPPEQLAQFQERDADRLEGLCGELKTLGIRATKILRHGIPFKEALAAADEWNVSLIVMGSQGRSAVREMLAGSTFENVARLSRQPVLVVRPSQHQVA